MRDDRRIDGWKAIGNFLGRDRTTAMRWARERGLPVHRVPGGQQGTVYALSSELDDWIAGDPNDVAQVQSLPVQPVAASPRRRRWPLALAGAFALAATAGFVVSRRPPEAAGLVSLSVAPSASANRESRRFERGLTADLARFANASAGLAVIDNGGSDRANSQYAVRVQIDTVKDAIVVETQLVARDGGMVLSSRRFEDKVDNQSVLRERIAANIVGITRCGFCSLDTERAQLRPADLAMLLSTCQTMLDGDLTQAVAKARGLTIARPDLAIGWAALASLQAIDGQDRGDASLVAAARTSFARAFAIAPDALATRLAKIDLVGSASPDALPLIDSALQKYPDNPDLLRALSVTLFNLGYVRASVEPALQAVQSDPTWLYGRDMAVRRLAAARRVDEARRLQAENEAIWPGHPAIVQQRERLRRESDKLPVAALRAQIATVERENAGTSGGAYLLAQLYERAGDRHQALSWLARAPVVDMQLQHSLLFWPSAAGLRTEPAFFGKMAALGLVRWWTLRRQWPDFCSEPKLKYDCAAEVAKLGAR